MRTVPQLTAALLLLLALGTGCKRDRSGGTRPGGSRDDAAAARLFSGDVLAFELTLDPAAMAALAREPRDYVEGTLRFADQRLDRVGVRFKGHRSMRKWSSKPAFKLDFDKHVKDQRLAGLRSLVLNNMVEDPTMVREQLGYEVFRALGVAAPRTGYAELSINGERFGLYAIVEAPEREFLARHYREDDGPLYEGEYGCDVARDQIESLHLETGDDPGHVLAAAFGAAAEGPIAGMLDGADAPLDPERFFAFLAGGAWLADFDGFRHAHNYRLYRDPGSERWSFLPWGLDRVLTRDMDVFDSHELLASECFADARCRLRYVQALHAALPRIDALDLPARFERALSRIAKVVARDDRRPYDDATRERRIGEARSWLRQRSAKVRAQIACWDGEHERDADRDGFGCSDCDDADPAVHPGASEVCNGRDDDCSRAIDDAADCACPEQVLEGARFALCDREVAWPRAAELCRQQGGALAFVENKAQLRALGRAVAAVRGTDWWIGLNDREREGRQVWEGGARSAFRDWASGEPDDYACAEDCGAIKDGEGGSWRDMACATPQPFVCRLPDPEKASTESPPAPP